MNASRHALFPVFLAVGVVLGVITARSPADAAGKNEAVVSFLSGDAEVSQPQRPNAWTRLHVNARVEVASDVRTLSGARLELRLADGSRIRLGEKSRVRIDRISGKKGSQTHRFDVIAGRLWAKVVRSVGPHRTFEVRTHNAVAGVRGTSFAVLADANLSSIIRVYSGTVGVQKGGFRRPAHVREVPGPRRIDQKQWEEVIASAKKQVRVTALGEITPAEDFEDQGVEVEWALWNQERDKAVEL